MRKSIYFFNQIDEISNLGEIIEKIGNELNMTSGEVFNINLILEEALSNIIFYGYNEDEKDKIEVVFYSDKDNLRMEIIDGAKPFNPVKGNQMAHDKLSDDTKIGGLGILLMRKLSKSMDYKRDNGKNHLTINIQRCLK